MFWRIDALLCDLFVPFHLVRTMHPVQKANSAKIDEKLLMMGIMSLRDAAEKIISTMYRGCLQQLYRQEQPEAQYVAM